MGIICPLVEIGLTDLEKSGGAYGTPRGTTKDDIPDDVVVLNSGYDVLFESNLQRGASAEESLKRGTFVLKFRIVR